jgi:ATP-dependent Clp protease ATP-binding subunit ClpB
MEDGRLTDGHGRTVNFKNTIVLMTSNADPADLKNRFRPEFLNRIDEILAFRSLTQKDLRRIVDIQLEQVRLRLADKRVPLQLTDEAKDFLSKEGYDPAYGARPLKRAVQRLLIDHLAKLLLSGDIREGQTVEVDAGKDGLSFKTAKGKAKVPST